MNKIAFFLTFVAFLFAAPQLQAQFNPKESASLMITAGVGISGWGIPLFGRIEVPVADNITVGGGVSYQSHNQFFGNSNFSHSIIGIHGRGNYHFNELFGMPDNFDLYAGASLGYWIWNTSSDIPGVEYLGGGVGGLGFAAQIGGRYLISEKFGINIEFGGGNVLTGGTLGATFIL